MFKRLRQLPISLAAKCQLLFGAAVALIIVAALFMPWQRMEQLTDQINERAARSICDDSLADHLAGLPANLCTGAIGMAIKPTTIPATMPAAGTTAPNTIGGHPYSRPRLILLWPLVQPEKLTWSEKRVITYFKDHPGAETYTHPYKAKDSSPYYRYAHVLHTNAGCARCHNLEHPQGFRSADGLPDSLVLPAGSTTRSSTGRQPSTLPASGTAIGVVTVDMPSQLDNNQLLLNRLFLLIAGVLVAVVATAVFYLITTHLILQPMHVLQDTAEKVSQGDLNIRSHINTGDEFEQLSRTFNVMLVNLKASQDQLRAINEGLDLKLGQLAESNVALYESNRLKSEFLANVSHELRTPLNSILGFAELLREPAEAEPKSARYVQNILASGKSLLDLINDLLDLAKIEAGRMEVRSVPLSLGDLFEGLSGIIKPLAAKGDLQIRTQVATDVPILMTDAAKLQQVLYNFLSNAIKFSPPGGIIELRAERHDENQIRISVTDQGPGIETDKQQIIFEKFRQLDGSVTRQHSGTGLGLAISKELVGLLSGTIGVQSQAGQGATFWIIIPVKIQARAQDLRQKPAGNTL